MLFKTSINLKTYAQLTGDFNFDSVKTTIQKVEDDYLVPILGIEQYEELNEAFATGENSLNDALAALLERCRQVVGPYVCVHFTPKADVQVGDGGSRRTETANVKTAFQYQTTAFIDENRREGERCQEKLLNFLELNKADYLKWVESDQFKKYRSQFIKTGSEFNEFFSSASPFRNYWAMRPKMEMVELLTIKKFLGAELFNELKTKDTREQDFSDTEKDLLYYIRLVIAYTTVAAAIPFLNVRIDANGITVMSIAFTSNDELSKRNAADSKSIDMLINSCTNSARQWLAEAEDHIRKNATDFASWKGFQTSINTAWSSLNEGRKGGTFGL